LEMFDTFVNPFERVFQGLQRETNYRTEPVLTAGIGLCCDLQGIVEAATDKRTYIMFFDWFQPKFLPIVLRLLETWWDNPTFTTPCLRFFSEFVLNKSQRILFDPSSPNGIILFRETSKALQMYGSRILSANKDRSDVVEDIYKSRLKGISLCLLILTRALSGDYCNFGVFSLYNDKALSNALNIVIKLILSVPLPDFISVSSRFKNLFFFLGYFL